LYRLANHMYHLYHTDAFVLGGTPSGEGSKTISLFTRELGFLVASAQSVREERSKLRYGLQDFSYSEITLVRGKEFWRVTNAALKENIFQALVGSREARRMVGRIFALLRRLLAGEEKNEPLFVAVLEGLQFIKSGNSPFPKGSTPSSEEGFYNPRLADSAPPLLRGINPPAYRPPPCLAGRQALRKEEQIVGAEIVLVLRILYLLGYLAPRDEFDPFLSHSALWDESIISNALLFRALAISEINQSLRETQL